MPIPFPPRKRDPLQGPLLSIPGTQPAGGIGPPGPLAGSMGQAAASPRFGNAGLAVILGQVAKAIDPNGIGGRLGQVGAGIGYNRLADQAMQGGPVSPLLSLQDRLAVRQEQRAQQGEERAEKYYRMAENQEERDAAFKDLQMEQLRYEAGKGRMLSEERLQGVIDYYNESTLAAKETRLAQMDDRQRELVERQNLKNLMQGMPSILESQGIKLPKELSAQALSGIDPSKAMSLLAPYTEKYVKRATGPSATAFAGTDELLGLPTGQSQNLYETGLLTTYASQMLSGGQEKLPDSVVKYLHSTYPETRELLGSGMTWRNFGLVSRLIETDPVNRDMLGLPRAKEKSEPGSKSIVPPSLDTGPGRLAGKSPSEIQSALDRERQDRAVQEQFKTETLQQAREIKEATQNFGPKARDSAEYGALYRFGSDAMSFGSRFNSGSDGSNRPTSLGAVYWDPVYEGFFISQGAKRAPRVATLQELIDYANLTHPADEKTPAIIGPPSQYKRPNDIARFILGSP